MNISDYKYIVVGAGLFGATIAERLANTGHSVLVIDRRDHLAGNVYSFTDPKTGIEIHKYGSHIFHTEDDEVWSYVNRFAEFNDYVHKVMTRHNGKLYPMPINLDTINLLYGKNMSGHEAEIFIRDEASRENITNPKNFEEKGISLVGKKLYSSFIKHYTEKQWSTDAVNLDADILRRIPARYDRNDRYFASAKYQGIPKNGYTKMVENMLKSKLIEIKLNTSFKEIEGQISSNCITVYCGQIDELFDDRFGILPYRSLEFKGLWTKHSQGYAVINEADAEIPYTRTHDYKYYQSHQKDVINQEISFLCQEYPSDFYRGKNEAYYPVNNEKSELLYNKYIELVRLHYPNMIVGGRLGAYRYWDMDVTIRNALDAFQKIISSQN